MENNNEELLQISKSELEEIKSKITMLEKVADKSRLEHWNTENGVLGPATYRVSTVDGKIVTGWKTIKDEVYKDPLSGIVRVTQAYEFELEDGSTYPVNGYNNFITLQYAAQLKGKELSRTVKDGNLELELELSNGKVIKIDARFVN